MNKDEIVKKIKGLGTIKIVGDTIELRDSNGRIKVYELIEEKVLVKGSLEKVYTFTAYYYQDRDGNNVTLVNDSIKTIKHIKVRRERLERYVLEAKGLVEKKIKFTSKGDRKKPYYDLAEWLYDQFPYQVKKGRSFEQMIADKTRKDALLKGALVYVLDHVTDIRCTELGALLNCHHSTIVYHKGWTEDYMSVTNNLVYNHTLRNNILYLLDKANEYLLANTIDNQ